MDGSNSYLECQGDLARQQKHRIGYATAPNDVWALGVILINLAAGRNPWKQASLQDDTFRAYLADPEFLLKILPISRELNRILKRIFCIDPLRRIGLKELKYRIQQCKFFTRTAEVDRWERLQDLASVNGKSLSSSLFDIPPYTRKPSRPSPTLTASSAFSGKGKICTTALKKKRYAAPPADTLPPSPPATPRDRSQQSHDAKDDLCMDDSLLAVPLMA